MAKAKASSVAFSDLLSFVQSKEDANTRIVAISSSDASAPESVVLGYSHPAVSAGDDGFTNQNGDFVAYG